MNSDRRKIVLAITGASGSIYAQKLIHKLQMLESAPEEISVVLSETARKIWQDEIGTEFVAEGTAKEYGNDNYYAPFASGSSQYDTMIVCPASMGTLGRLANGISNTLIARSADVMLKEGRKLIIVPREAPYSLIHVKNMKKLIRAGAVICPASPSFYSKPTSIDDLVMTIVDRVIDLAGFNNHTFRWNGND